MKQRMSYLIAVITLFSFMGLSYAGLEETKKWYEDGLVSGTWTVSDGILKVSDVNNTGFYVCTNSPEDNYTLKLRAKIDKVNNQDEYGVVLHFGGYKLILNGKGTTTTLYKAISKTEWKPLWIDGYLDRNPKINLETGAWYEIEILKYQSDIEIKIGTQTIQKFDFSYWSGRIIGLGAINSEVWFDEVNLDLSKKPITLYPSQDGLSHKFFTTKAVDNYFPSEPNYNYKDCTIKGGWEEDSYNFDGPARHFYNPDTGKGLYYLLIQWDSALQKAKDVWGNQDSDKDTVIGDYIRGRKYMAYYHLGRVCHLLEDMLSPAHANVIPHLPLLSEDDVYEKYCKGKTPSDDYSSSAIKNIDNPNLDNFFKTAAYHSTGKATEKINNIEASTINEIIKKVYSLSSTGNGEYKKYNVDSNTQDTAQLFLKRAVPKMIIPTNKLYTPTDTQGGLKGEYYESIAISKDIIPSANLPGGLMGEYYDNKDLTNLIFTRTDSTIDFNWGREAPKEGNNQLEPDTFSIRWTGKLKVDYEGKYTIYTYTDDGVRLWIDDKLIINAWYDQKGENSAQISLSKGEHTIKMEYYENTGAAQAKLLWEFAGERFGNLKLTRTDTKIEFDWGYDSPDSSIPSDKFAVRWTGKIYCDYDKNYTFYTYSDDGVRLWIDGTSIIDSWVDQKGWNSGTKQLSKGFHTIKMEYYENTGNATAKLYWETPEDNVNVDTLAKYLCPTAVMYAGAVIKYFDQTKIGPNPSKLDYIDNDPMDSYFINAISGEARRASVEVWERIKYQLTLINQGDPTNVSVRIKITYKDNADNTQILYNDTQNHYFNPGEKHTFYTSELTVPQTRAWPYNELNVECTLNYAGVVHTFSDSVKINPEKLKVDFEPKSIDVEKGVKVRINVKNSQNNVMKDVAVSLYGCGVSKSDKTNNNGDIEFDIIPTKLGDITLTADASALGNYEVEIKYISVVPPVPQIPTLLSPENGATVITLKPKFDWNDVPWATQYKIQVAKDSEFKDTIIDTQISVSEFTPLDNLSKITYYWRVLASNQCGSSSWSPVWSFNIKIMEGDIKSPEPNSIIKGKIYYDLKITAEGKILVSKSGSVPASFGFFWTGSNFVLAVFATINYGYTYANIPSPIVTSNRYDTAYINVYNKTNSGCEVVVYTSLWYKDAVFYWNVTGESDWSKDKSIHGISLNNLSLGDKIDPYTLYGDIESGVKIKSWRIRGPYQPNLINPFTNLHPKLLLTKQDGTIIPMEELVIDAEEKFIVRLKDTQDLGNLYVKITGEVAGADRYILEYGKGSTPSIWDKIIESNQQVDGILGYWDVTGLQDSRYKIRLKIDGVIGDEVEVTIDLNPPNIINFQVVPESVASGETITITAKVEDEGSGVKSVTIHLNPIGGDSNQQMYDDGTHGDEISNDGVYTYKTTISESVLSGIKKLIITTEDNISNISKGTITLQVINPKITSVLPISGTIGTKVTVNGEGYLASEQIRLDFGTTMSICLTTADAQGRFIAGFRVNSQPYGLKIITATGITSGGVAKSNFTITPPPGSISGTVTTSTGVPIPDVIVCIWGVQTTTTDKNGGYKLVNLPAGKYEVQARPKESQQVEIKRDVVVEPGKDTANINFTIDYSYKRYAKDIYVSSRHGENYTFFLEVPSNYQIYDGGYYVYYSKRARDDGTFIDSGGKRLVIRVRLDGKWYSKAYYDANYWVWAKKPIIEMGYKYGGNNEQHIQETLYEETTRTYYLYPSDTKYKLYKWEHIVHNAKNAWDDGSYIDEVNNRLVIKVRYEGKIIEFHWWWWHFVWKREAYYDATYYVYGKEEVTKKGDEEKGKLVEIPVKRVDTGSKTPKKSTPVIKLMLSSPTHKLPANTLEEPSIAILVKDVEEELTTIRLQLSYNSAEMQVADVRAPNFEDETIKVHLQKEVNNQVGKIDIGMVIVDEDDVYREEKGTSSDKVLPQRESRLMLEEEENIAPLAYLVIDVPQFSKSLASQKTWDQIISSLRIDEVELKDVDENVINVKIDEQNITKVQYESNLEKVYCYPNPTKDKITFAKLTKRVKVRIFNIAGELVYGEQEHDADVKAEWTWDCKNNAGEKVASGIYIYILQDPVSGSVKKGKLGVMR